MRILLVSILVFFSINLSSQNISYKEQYRPQYHFSPTVNWMNDPNGMVYYKGEYHLFYQYYPDSTVWGPMHWGHAISKDLIHWQHLPIALYPDSIGYIFSGSVVVDKDNTAGFKNGIESPLVALFTYHNIEKEKAGASDFQSQGFAYSLDKGRTWKKYKNNPVIKNNGIKDFRDPKVFWHQQSSLWIMTLAVANKVEFYKSKNLKDWEYSGSFGEKDGSHGGVWECPDLFEMNVEGTNTKKWVLIVSIGNGGPNGGSATQYFIGDFNGNTFTNSNKPETTLWVDYGPDNYAGVTWSNTGDKKLFLGWMSNWNYAQKVPTVNWRSAMTIPRALKLKNTKEGILLYSNPVKELQALRTSSRRLNQNKKTHFAKGLYEVKLEVDLTKTSALDFGLSFSNAAKENIKVGFNKLLNQFYVDRSEAGEHSFSELFTNKSIAARVIKNNILSLQIFIDHSSIEVFADDGAVLMTSIFFPSQSFNDIKLYQHDGSVSVKNQILYYLKSIW